jgi:hypothetical protein
MTRPALILAAMALVGCQEIVAPVEQPVREVAPSWCAMYLEDPEGFVYADSGATCPNGRQARAVEIWWPADKRHDCGSWTHLGPRARNRWGCNHPSPNDTVFL